MEVLTRPVSFAELTCIQKVCAESFTVYRIMINTNVLLLICFIGGTVKGFFWLLNAGVNSMSCLTEAALKRGGTPRLDTHGRKLLIYGRAVLNILYLLLCGKIRLFTAVVMFVNG